MSLAGVRDLSVIETPPPGRMAIQTYLIPFRKNVLAQAVRWHLEEGTDGLVPEGNEQPNAPNANFNGLIRYEIPVSKSFTLALQTDFKYQSEMFRSADNDPLTKTDAHFLINGRIALTSSNGRWELALWGKNLGHEDVILSGFNTPILGIVTEVYSPPRTFGLSFAWSL